jgi:hypothetical protein
MSAFSLPVTRPTGRALIVGLPACRIAPAAALQRQGFACTEVDHPYDAMLQLSNKPLFFSAMILSLHSLYREELQIIPSIKRRFTHVEIWLADTDGRQAALAEAMRLGADGLVAPDGLHRMAAAPLPIINTPILTPSNLPPTSAAIAPPSPPVVANESEPIVDESTAVNASALDSALKSTLESASASASGQPHIPPPPPADPLLTAEELRALLQETPTPPGN